MSAAFDPAEHMTRLRGKGGAADYLEVKWRLVWLRDRDPDARIETEALELTADRAVFRAVVTLASGGRATGHGSETPKDFGDYIEKAETKAVGRALAMLGFGTQFAPELEEGHRIVDSPVEPRPAPSDDPNAPSEKQFRMLWALARGRDCDADDLHELARIKAGKEHTRQLTRRECSGLIDWLQERTAADIAPLLANARRDRARQRGQQDMPLDAAAAIPDEDRWTAH